MDSYKTNPRFAILAKLFLYVNTKDCFRLDCKFVCLLRLSLYGILLLMKIIYTISIIAFGTLFSWIGELMDHGNWLGGWSILLGTVGSILGIFIGYKINKAYF